MPPGAYDREAGLRAFHGMVERSRRVEELGFDWVSVSEHHYSPRILTPSLPIAAAYIASHVHNIKIALLGPIVPQSNPVLLAEEMAMLDTMAEGRLNVGMLRGTTNEMLTYDLNPEESRERIDEGMELILRPIRRRLQRVARALASPARRAQPASCGHIPPTTKVRVPARPVAVVGKMIRSSSCTACAIFASGNIGTLRCPLGRAACPRDRGFGGAPCRLGPIPFQKRTRPPRRYLLTGKLSSRSVSREDARAPDSADSGCCLGMALGSGRGSKHSK
jgi:hypothetical protein